MNPHARRTITLRVAIAALTLTIPAAWTIGQARAAWRWIRYRANRRRRKIPGLPADGGRLTPAEAAALISITRGWKQATPERTPHP